MFHDHDVTLATNPLGATTLWPGIPYTYSELTGFTERAFKKRLDGLEMRETGNVYQYKSKQALATLYSANDYKAAMAIFKDSVNEALDELASGNIK